MVAMVWTSRPFDQDCTHGWLLIATRVGHNTGDDGPLHKILRSSGLSRQSLDRSIRKLGFFD
jgi:hypothetical protein